MSFSHTQREEKVQKNGPECGPYTAWTRSVSTPTLTFPRRTGGGEKAERADISALPDELADPGRADGQFTVGIPRGLR